MRGTGYAIGEILIFLAIAAIIGFLIGWLVFYRRPDKGTGQLSQVNPNHVRRLEERSKSVDAKLGRIEKRANALLALLSKAPRPSGEAATSSAAPDTVIAPAAAAPIDVAKGEEKDTDTPTTPGDKPKATATAGTPPDKGDKADEKPKDADKAKAPEDKADATEDKAAARAPKEPAATAQDKALDPATAKDGADTEVDGYLSEADDRISKLEDTLDKLSEKLAELEDD